MTEAPSQKVGKLLVGEPDYNLEGLSARNMERGALCREAIKTHAGSFENTLITEASQSMQCITPAAISPSHVLFE